ncbi:MAG: FAD-dependent oxidoreductase [Christensenella sp.]|uniref:FAD-dependent oxidoreductase n=1 Tax=Christensenella sp. TaxID=1935934 RepID=UPI002B1F26D7|nr:FAD-dependent oxidoreductase [Christensenella sp.]MEA5003420.1 FAD-dependent oxidoreductase [Christensenella sp.]
MKKIVIVGGVAGGAGTAARMRRLEEDAQIILLEKGDYISFANCGLPYYIGNEIEDRDDLLVMTVQGMKERFDIDIRVKHEVFSIDRQKKTVSVKNLIDQTTYEEAYDTLVLSPGSTPFIPDIPGASDEAVFTLWNMFDTDRLKGYVLANKPQKALVAGGGFIGLEMVENLRGLGIDVTLVEMLDQVMPNVDFEMAQIVHTALKKHDVHLKLGRRLDSLARIGGKLTATLDNGEQVETDMVVMAVGVRPQSGLAKQAGLACGEKGGIIVDKFLRTSDENIYALGDAIEVKHLVSAKLVMIPLAGPANKQARICADNIHGDNLAYRGSMGSSVAKVFELTVASTGLNERQLKELGWSEGREYFVAKTHAWSHATYYPGSTQMALKVFYAPDGKILGASAVGKEGVDKRMDVIATTMYFGGTVHDLGRLQLCYAPPYSSAKDPVNMIGFMAENNLSGQCRFISWDQLDGLDPQKYAVLDVREDGEVARGMIDGAIHIPLGQLRSRISELDKNKTIVVCCAIGLRAYVACRILTGHGFEAIDLSGGYTTYSMAHRKI